MVQYLGISMVIVVTGLVIAILARLVTGGILDEIEKIRQARFEKRVKVLTAALKEGLKYGEKYVRSVKECIELDEKYRQRGEIDKASEMAKDAFEKTMSEMKSDYGL